jgi:hypothetical protein
MRAVIGFSQKIKWVWMEALLDQLLQTTDTHELRQFLDARLKDNLPGKESRAKAIGILLRIWSSVPQQQFALRDRALELLPTITGQERLWLHWGMAALAYPFFRDAAEVVGRLLMLQEDFTTAQVRTRLVATWGDRTTTKEAAQKLITTLVDWEVLRSTKTKGHFLQANKQRTASSSLQLWLLEALLSASFADEVEAQQLLRLPEAFPFQLTVAVNDLRRYDGFDIHRQGLDMEMVAGRIDMQPRAPKSEKAAKKYKGRAATTALPTLFDDQPEDTVLDHAELRADTETPTVTPKVEAQPVPPVTLDGITEQNQVEEAIKNEVLRTLSERAGRYLQARGVQLVLNGPFAVPINECVEQFRDGHYYGCIALAQAIMEMMICHIWQVELRKRKSQKADFKKNLEVLHKKGVVTDDWKAKLDHMWSNRHAFHHLRSSVETDRQELEAVARNHLRLLNELQQTFFGSSVNEGVVPKYAEHCW